MNAAGSNGAEGMGGVRRIRRDPLGKQALYWLPGGEGESEVSIARRGRHPSEDLGRRALFSDAGGSGALRRRGPIQLECSRCHETSEVELVDFLRLHLPVWLWMPWRSHSRYMQCPACGQRTWIRARITLLADELGRAARAAKERLG